MRGNQLRFVEEFDVIRVLQNEARARTAERETKQQTYKRSQCPGLGLIADEDIAHARDGADPRSAGKSRDGRAINGCLLYTSRCV